MRRSFALVVLPLALAALVPVLLLQRAGPHEQPQPPWGIDAARLASLRVDGARLGLVASSVRVLEAGAPSRAGDTVLLEGLEPEAGRCVVVVHGRSAGPLHCLRAVFARRPVFVVTYAGRPGPGAGSPMLWALGVVRGDVRLALTGEGRDRTTLPLLAGGAFNLGIPGRSTRLRLYDARRRLLADLRLGR